MSLQQRRVLALSLAGWNAAGRAALASASSPLRLLLHLAGWWTAAVSTRRLASLCPCGFTLRRWHLLISAALAAQVARWARWAVAAFANSWRQRGTKQRLRLDMKTANSHSEWLAAAVAMDELTGRACKSASASEVRGRRQLEQRTAVLSRLRQSDDITGLAFALRLDYLRQAGNASSSALVEAAGQCPVVPEAVQQYIDEVKRCLHHIVTSPDMALEDRLAFLRELRHAYGRTGLVLSGGGSFGFWHFGVVRALLDAKLLPRVVSGSSAGSIGASLLCTRTDDEVRTLVADFPTTGGLDFYANNSTSDLLRHLLGSGYIQNHDFFQGRLRRLLGDLTFLDAYQRTGRVLNIAVTAADTQEPSRLLNYLTAPNVLIWSAVACSSAFPFLFAPQDLLAKDACGNFVRFSETGAAQSQRRWCDGSLEEDLPMRGLSQLFGVNFFIASQSNPWLIGVVALKNLIPTALGRLLESEFKHRCQQLQAFWPGNRLLTMLAQPWEGDITVVLPPTAFPLGKAAVNFTTEDIFEAMRHGQHAVWAKLPAIQAACAIEVCIEELLQQVTLQVRQQDKLERVMAQRQTMGRRGLRATLPSWLHMPSLGLPPVDSSCSLATSGDPQSRCQSAAGDYLTSDLDAVADEGEGAGMEAGARPADTAAALAAEGSPPVRPGPSTPKAVRFHPSSSPSSRESSQHSDTAAQAALSYPPEQAAALAAAGVQATAGQLAVAGVEVAAEVLEPGTPADRSVDNGTSPGQALFASHSNTWRDLVVLSGISGGATTGGNLGTAVDSIPY
ncbi:hypothetical protein D9Q98_006545 [Chlorella vulgaris]|uniref:PNPLA domain-containing protein n=1 Tax=Chlorella vulgaris TaxID=3077 RepID=A0A9D4TKF7_CHLVU|nr:hypothetical protein D9Q98_006545 [Chlorella vulgaris]